MSVLERAPVPVVPDAARVVIDFLRAQPELAQPLGGRIYSELPGSVAWPAVRITRWGGWAAINGPFWLDEAMCQVDTWGGPKAHTSELARLQRSLIGYRLAAERADVVSGVRLGYMADAPDQSYTPAKPHFRFDIVVMVHPPREPAAPARANP